MTGVAILHVCAVRAHRSWHAHGYVLEQGVARGASLAGSGYFAPALPVGRDADTMIRMLAVYGRAA